MESGKFYKSTIGGIVVFCTSVLDDEIFAGVVIDSGRTDIRVGFVSYEGNHFHQHSFKEYAPVQVLVNGCAYDIPEGCKATIKNGKVSVEHSVDYKKKKWNDLTRYIMVKPGKNISIDMFGNEFVKITMDINEASYDCYDRSSKEEFMKNYNKALKALEL